MNGYCQICHTYTDDLFRSGKVGKLTPTLCSEKCFVRLLRISSKPELLQRTHGQPYPSALSHADRRSALERRFEKWLSRTGLSYSYEPWSFELDAKTWYVPDYEIKENVYIEIKGLWNAGDKQKVLKFVKKFGFALYVIDEPFMRRLRL